MDIEVVFTGDADMLRQSFVRRLKAIGDIPVPEGHLRRNKGVTTYFFDKERFDDLQAFLGNCGLVNKGQVPMYEIGTTQWDKQTSHSHRVFLHANPDQPFVSLAILQWPN